MRLVVSILLLVVMTISLAGGELTPQHPEVRIMPPTGLQCARNDLTVYDGKVLAYRRRKGRTTLRIRTNFDTIETIAIRHPGTDDPSAFYLINGKPFMRSDWRRIEKKRNILRPKMRANVWVCRDKPEIQPVVDWRPDDIRVNATLPAGARQRVSESLTQSGKTNCQSIACKER
jgi:hypothetical protein